MNNTETRKPKTKETGPEWPRKVQPGRAGIKVYRRKTPAGNWGFMVARKVDGKRHFDSYANEQDALAAAGKLAEIQDDRDFLSTKLSKEQSLEYISATDKLRPLNLTVDRAAATLIEAVKLVGDPGGVLQACRVFSVQNKTVRPLPIDEAVQLFIGLRKSDGASKRSIEDFESRLGAFLKACPGKTTASIRAADVQDWLDGLQLAPQTKLNFRAVLVNFFEYCRSRAYCAFNPAADTQKVKVRKVGGVAIFTPEEIARLLAAAKPDFLPCLAIGAFAGLRSAEIERLEWKDIDLAARHIVVGADKAKTATRRIVPIADNLAAWLAPYAGRKGNVWPGGHYALYDAQQDTAAATAVTADEAKGIKAQEAVQWKANAMRHSYASYRFAQTADAGRVAGEMGNSASVVHSHYRELVKPAAAAAWFSVKADEAPANVVALPAAAQA